MKSIIILLFLTLAFYSNKSYGQSGKKYQDDYIQKTLENKKDPKKNMFKSEHKKEDTKKKKAKYYSSSKTKKKSNTRSSLIDHSPDDSNKMSKNLTRTKK